MYVDCSLLPDGCAEEHAGQSGFKGGETMGVGEGKPIESTQNGPYIAP